MDPKKILAPFKGMLSWVCKSKARIVGVIVILSLIIVAVFYKDLMPYTLNHHEQGRQNSFPAQLADDECVSKA